MKQTHAGKFGNLPYFGEKDRIFEFFLKSHLHAKPYGLGAARAGFEVFSGLELRFVGARSRNDLGKAVDSGDGASRMVKQHAVPFRHFARHEISSLVITYSKPRGFSVASEVVDGIFGRFGLHQPITHDEEPLRFAGIGFQIHPKLVHAGIDMGKGGFDFRAFLIFENPD